MYQNILEVKVVPFKHQRPCSYPGCLELTSERYCSKHITVTVVRGLDLLVQVSSS